MTAAQPRPLLKRLDRHSVNSYLGTSGFDKTGHPRNSISESSSVSSSIELAFE